MEVQVDINGFNHSIIGAVFGSLYSVNVIGPTLVLLSDDSPIPISTLGFSIKNIVSLSPYFLIYIFFLISFYNVVSTSMKLTIKYGKLFFQGDSKFISYGSEFSFFDSFMTTLGKRVDIFFIFIKSLMRKTSKSDPSNDNDVINLILSDSVKFSLSLLLLAVIMHFLRILPGLTLLVWFVGITIIILLKFYSFKYFVFKGEY